MIFKNIFWLLFKKRFNRIEGFLSEKEGEWLFKTSAGLPAKSTIVEVGSFKGKSTSCLALGSIFSRNEIYAVDTFEGNDSDFVKSSSTGEVFKNGFLEEFRKNINFLNFDKQIRIKQGLSSGIAKKWNKKIDFIFIDASHEFEDVVSDFNNFYPFVKDGGIMAFHDVNKGWPGPYKAWNSVVSKKLNNTGKCGNIAFGYKYEKTK